MGGGGGGMSVRGNAGNVSALNSFSSGLASALPNASLPNSSLPNAQVHCTHKQMHYTHKQRQTDRQTDKRERGSEKRQRQRKTSPGPQPSVSFLFCKLFAIRAFILRERRPFGTRGVGRIIIITFSWQWGVGGGEMMAGVVLLDLMMRVCCRWASRWVMGEQMSFGGNVQMPGGGGSDMYAASAVKILLQQQQQQHAASPLEQQLLDRAAAAQFENRMGQHRRRQQQRSLSLYDFFPSEQLRQDLATRGAQTALVLEPGDPRLIYTPHTVQVTHIEVYAVVDRSLPLHLHPPHRAGDPYRVKFSVKNTAEYCWLLLCYSTASTPPIPCS